MQIVVFQSPEELAVSAARSAADIIRTSIRENGKACVVAATGVSQMALLEVLTREPGIDWAKTVFFHLDEYVGLQPDHQGRFVRYLKEWIVDRVRPGAFHFIDGLNPDPKAECERLGKLISEHIVDLAFAGIGENGHLAFNDPPADFETNDPYITVKLSEMSRLQQLKQGWFQRMEYVPREAISMSIRQIMKSRRIICLADGTRKAQAVHDCYDGEVSPMHPASILRKHPAASLYLDTEAAALLKNRTDLVES